MLQTLKSTIVLGTLLVVGYGVHVMLNRPPDGFPDTVWNDSTDLDLPEIDFGEESLDRPPTSLTTSPLSAERPLATSSASIPPSPISQPESAPSGFPTQTANLREGASPTVDPVARSTTHAATDVAAADPSSAGFSPPLPAASLQQDPPRATISSVSHVASSFDNTWSTAHEKLLHGQLVDALLSLSFLYSDEQLRDTQRNQLIQRLDQLAGSVIYSQDHLMERPYVVQAGEGWEQIAGKYQVPARFLARVNGLPVESPPPANATLKVVRGPFRGELSLSRRELTLFLGRHYAGRFDVGIGRDLPAHVTAMEVTEKTAARPYTDVRTGEVISAGAAESPYGSLWIGLRDLQLPSDSPLGIHSTGAAIGAADTRGCITVSDRDADDLQAILSLGSPIEILR